VQFQVWNPKLFCFGSPRVLVSLLVANINECEFINNLRGKKHEKWAFEVKGHLKLQKRDSRVELGRQGLARVMDAHTV
jgi:hypothetical protein